MVLNKKEKGLNYLHRNRITTKLNKTGPVISQTREKVFEWPINLKEKDLNRKIKNLENT